MKAEKEFKKAIELLNALQMNHKKLGRMKVVIQHAKYVALIRRAAHRGNIEAQFELGLNYEDQNYFAPNPMYNKKRGSIGM